MEARGLGVREVARRVPCNPGHISNLRSGKARPSPELAADLDKVLDADGTLAALAPAQRRHRVPAPDLAGTDDEIAALEFARRAEASDIGNSVVEQPELTVDDLATAYPASATPGARSTAPPPPLHVEHGPANPGRNSGETRYDRIRQRFPGRRNGLAICRRAEFTADILNARPAL